MTTDLDRAVRSSLGDIIAAAPEPDDEPIRLLRVGSDARTRRPYMAVAASLVVLAGVGGLVALGTNDATPAAAPSATGVSSAPTTSTDPGDTASSAVVDATPICAIPGTQALVPNVAGMAWVDAAAVLVAAGFEPAALPMLPGPLETATDAEYYFIIRQATAPGTITSCGAIVDITVAYRPGILYIVQEGDTYESIAASQGITLEQFLGFSGLSVTEIEASGQGPATPLALGQALPLSSELEASGQSPGVPLALGQASPVSIDPATPNTVATTTTMP